MSCYKNTDSCNSSNTGYNYFFIVLILFILLAIIWGGAY